MVKKICEYKKENGLRCRKAVDTSFTVGIDNKFTKNTYFCTEHMNTLKNFVKQMKYQKMSGIYYDDSEFSEKGIEESHNCTAYALNKIMRILKKICIKQCQADDCDLNSECRHLKPQPGKLSGIKDRIFNCPDMIFRTIIDNPNIYISDFETGCKKGYYKGAVVINPYKGYHYYRQDKPRSKKAIPGWSHKPGSTPVTKKDKSGRFIYNPLTCDRKYRGNNYKEFCNFFCIPNENLNLEHQDMVNSGGKNKKKYSKKKIY